VARRLGQLVLAGVAMIASAGWWVATVELLPASARPYIGGSQTNSILELTFGYNGFGRLTGNETGSVGGAPGGGWGQTGWTRMFGPEVGGQIAWLLPAALILLAAGLWLTWGAARRQPSGHSSNQATLEPSGWSGNPASPQRTGSALGPPEGERSPGRNWVPAAVHRAALPTATVPSATVPTATVPTATVPTATVPTATVPTATLKQATLQRAAFGLWGGWLVVTGLVFSFMQGIFHAYYAVALAPAVGALVGMGVTMLWRVRERVEARLALAGTVAVTAVWSWVLLRRTPEWHPGLAPLVLVGGLAVAAALAAGSWSGRGRRRLAVAVAGGGLLVALAGPAAYSLDTAATPHGGAIPSAGPDVPGARGGPGGGPRGAFRGGPPGAQNGQVPFGRGGFGQGMGPGRGFGQATPGQGTGPGFGQGPGGMGGLLDGGTPDAELVALLKQDAGSYTWVAAAVGSNSAAGAQLATGEPVMAIGGFNGSDPAPTLEQFQQFVAEGRIHYFLGGGRMGGGSMGGSVAARQISAWVQQRFTASSVGGATVYDLTDTSAAGVGPVV
jgi:4-amino-4-deoxy-L-arabinose transferase-like glycosyltransferase